ncbi:MAG: PilZ domain-containing protein [Gammaproteobacteria bacterium]|jgi:hypothetical protein
MKTLGNAQLQQRYEESRQYPRIVTKLPIKLFTDDGECIIANIYDVSADGLQIRCDRENTVILNPELKPIYRSQNIMVDAVFRLPINNVFRKVEVSCRVYYFIIAGGGSRKEGAFGLQFKKFESKTIKYIGQYILEQMNQVSEELY